MIIHNGNLIDIPESLEQLTQEQPQYLTDCTIYGHHVNLSAMKLKNDNYLLLLGNDNPDKVEDYKNRWDSEEWFGCLKSRGFNFEDTHLTKPPKISKMRAILTMAFIWAVQTGQWLNQINPITQKKTLKRPLKSIFRYGLDKLQDVLLNIHHGTKNLLFFEFVVVYLENFLRNSRPNKHPF
ncbi:transposase [Thioploca ingrica]|uniref:Transposase n=1 Tax=Thioploca ingrica TaxID=40754 RepID=A0A090AH36_9GAMM|nr:transposase [Thioploca ingrica]